MIIRPTRRDLILGIGASLLAAPAIVRAGSLMKVKAIDTNLGVTFNGWVDEVRITKGDCWNVGDGTFTIEAWVKRPTGEPWRHWQWIGDGKGPSRCYADGVLQTSLDEPPLIEVRKALLMDDGRLTGGK